MKRFLSLDTVLIISLVFSLSATAAAARDLKIGIVDTPRILSEAKAAKSANDTLQKDLEAKRATLAPKEVDVRRMEEEVKKATAADKKDKDEKLAQLVKEYKRLNSDLGEDLKKKKDEMARKLLGEIRQIVKTIFEKENYALILEKGYVVMSENSMDITDKVIKLYDAQKK